MTFSDRLFYGWHEVKFVWHARHLGVGYMVRVLWLIASFVVGFQVRCFGYPGDCSNRAHWDPIVGAYCRDCHNAMVGFRERKSGVPLEER